MFFGPGGISHCFSPDLFCTANFNMNKSMQILSQEMLVICRSLPILIIAVLNERNGQITF